MNKNDQISSVPDAADYEPKVRKGDITEDNDEVKRKRTDGVDVEYKSTGSGSASVNHKLRPGMKDTNEEPQSPEEIQVKFKTASRALFPTAKRVGTMQNILILGTARAGKYSIAKYIATDSQDFPRQDSEKGIGVVHHYIHHDYNFVIIDTGGAHTKSDANEKHSIEHTTIKKDIEHCLVDGINLILLVVRRDCCTIEELTYLSNIIEALFTKASREYIALVHTGCENYEDDERKKYIESFRKSEGPAGKLSSLCRKGVCAVGFPDLKETSKHYFQLYQESINISKRKIRKLVNDSKTIQPHSELFSAKKHLIISNFPVGNFSCVLM